MWVLGIALAIGIGILLIGILLIGIIVAFINETK